MRERGVVRAAIGDRYEVLMAPPSAEGCGSCRACGEGPGALVLVAAGPAGVPAGAVVEVEVGEVAGAGAAAVGFLLPVLALAAGAVVGGGLPGWLGAGFPPTAGGVLGALVGLALAFIVVRAYDRALRRRMPEPRIVRVID